MRIESHIHWREDGQQRHGPGDPSGAIAHIANIDSEVNASEYHDADELDGNCEEDSTVIKGLRPRLIPEMHRSNGSGRTSFC